MSDHLNPCPFCGGDPTIHTQMVSKYKFVSCSKCRSDGPLKDKEREAIAAWNRRCPSTKAATPGDAP